MRKIARVRSAGPNGLVIGYATREELACEPAKFFVRVVKRKNAARIVWKNQGWSVRHCPEQIVPKGKLANEMIIELLVNKYQQHLPIYRQQAELAENHGIELSRKTLTDAVLAAGSLLQAVVRAQRRELLTGSYLQADETPLPLPDAGEDGPQPPGVSVGIQRARRGGGV